jgi:hypothetical protein
MSNKEKSLSDKWLDQFVQTDSYLAFKPDGWDPDFIG